MTEAMNERELSQLVPLDPHPLPLEQDPEKRASMHAAATRWQRAWESFHGPLHLPARDDLLAVATSDFVLTYNGSPHTVGVDEVLRLVADCLDARIDVAMSASLLEVGEDTAWMYDVHTWSLPDGTRFESERYGRLYRERGGERICRWEVLQTNPLAAQDFFDNQMGPALRRDEER